MPLKFIATKKVAVSEALRKDIMQGMLKPTQKVIIVTWLNYSV